MRSSVFLAGKPSNNVAQYQLGREVVRDLRCDYTTVSRLIKDSVLRGRVIGSGHNTTILVTRKSVEQLKRLLESSVGRVAAAKMLGVTGRTELLLEKSRLIKSQPNPVRRFARLLSRKAVDGLLSSIDGRVSQCDETT